MVYKEQAKAEAGRESRGAAGGGDAERTPFLSVCTSVYFCCGGERVPARLTAHTELRGKLAKASSSAVRGPGIELPAVRLGGNFPSLVILPPRSDFVML